MQDIQTMTKVKEKRPAIPPAVQLKLWIRSGGRCQLCNEVVYEDGFTLKEVNWSNIAHIISCSPNGPRGHKTLSKKLAQDYSNLMLMCSKHAKLIDTKPYVVKYPVEKLKLIKDEHEKRIETLTAITNEAQTYPLIIQSNIGEIPVEINFKEVEVGITENRMYPKDKPFLINLTGDISDGTADYYNSKALIITEKIKAFLDKFNDLSERQHISIFPIALMPLLVHLGKEIGDKHSIQLFQHHRSPSSWVWLDEEVNKEYIIDRPNSIESSKEVYLKIALSDSIGTDKINTLGKISKNIYQIRIENPTTRFLTNRVLVPKFDAIYRQVLNEIQLIHGHDCTIHLLLAVPAPIAVQCGLSLLSRKDPAIWAYDYDKKHGGFIKALRVN